MCSMALTIPQEISKWRTLRSRRTRRAHEDIFGGVDKLCDNHFSYDQIFEPGIYKSSFDSTGDSITFSTNMYVVGPTEEAIQLDGSWTSYPSGGSGDALQNAVELFVEALCSSVKQENEVCTNCINTRWRTFSSAGCHIADVVNYCVSSSPSPSPSPSPRCAYLVGEQCPGLSGRSCMNCAYSNRASWMPLGCTIPGREDEVGAACSSSKRVVV